MNIIESMQFIKLMIVQRDEVVSRERCVVATKQRIGDDAVTWTGIQKAGVTAITPARLALGC